VDDGNLFGIGELARRTRLPVRTIRFYSDVGLLPPVARSAARYRIYDEGSVARLDVVRTLRDLGLDLPTVGRLLACEATISDVAAAQVAALDAQIRTLRLRQAVLRAAAGRDLTLKEIELMHRLASLSNHDRRAIITSFIEDAFGSANANPALVTMLRSMVPDLPDDPTTEQIEAWVELAELVQDKDFRASVRRMAEYQAAQRAGGADGESELHGELVQLVTERAAAARSAGIGPTSEQAKPIVRELVRAYAKGFGRLDDEETARWMLQRFEVANDQRVERYWQLLAVISGSPPPPAMAPAFEWCIAALRGHTARGAASGPA
jgi:DNA-binding transcriptional MerR regulator